MRWIIITALTPALSFWPAPSPRSALQMCDRDRGWRGSRVQCKSGSVSSWCFVRDCSFISLCFSSCSTFMNSTTRVVSRLFIPIPITTYARHRNAAPADIRSRHGGCERERSHQRTAEKRQRHHQSHSCARYGITARTNSQVTCTQALAHYPRDHVCGSFPLRSLSLAL